MVHRFSMKMWYPSGSQWETYEYDETQPRMLGGRFTCVIVGGARDGQKVAIHNDMIVQAITDTHTREDTGMSRPGCYCGYCHRKRMIEQTDGRSRYWL